MKYALWTVAASFAFSVTGCADDQQLQDGRDDAFVVDGKTDTGGIREGTPEAAAVLHVVNTSSRAVLGDEVGVAEKAGDNIIAVRDGDDGAAGTADDTTFTTLAQLDAVPFVGPVAFGKLLAYAVANDIVGDVPVVQNNDPFADDACPGAPTTAAEAKAERGTIGSYQFVVRTRNCVRDGVSNYRRCESWTSRDISWLGWGPHASGVLNLTQQDAATDLTELKLVSSSCSSTRYSTVGTSCRGVGQAELSCFAYNSCTDAVQTYDKNVAFTGKLTKSCVALKSNVNSSTETYRPNHGWEYTQIQLGLISHR